MQCRNLGDNTNVALINLDKHNWFRISGMYGIFPRKAILAGGQIIGRVEDTERLLHGNEYFVSMENLVGHTPSHNFTDHHYDSVANTNEQQTPNSGRAQGSSIIGSTRCEIPTRTWAGQVRTR
jgi:hypothetical protein